MMTFLFFYLFSFCIFSSVEEYIYFNFSEKYGFGYNCLIGLPNCLASSSPLWVDTTLSDSISALFATSRTCAESQLYVLIWVALKGKLNIRTNRFTKIKISKLSKNGKKYLKLSNICSKFCQKLILLKGKICLLNVKSVNYLYMQNQYFKTILPKYIQIFF